MGINDNVTDIIITTDNKVINAKLYDNDIAIEFKNMLPLEVDINESELGYMFILQSPIKQNNYTLIVNTYEKGDIAYCNDCNTVFIFNDNYHGNESHSLIPIGKITENIEDLTNKSKLLISTKDMSELTIGTSSYGVFTLDNIYHSLNYGDIHYHSYIPNDYNSSKKYSLYISLPGYNGLYFQGIGANIYTEDFVFEARKYDSEMIIIAPQLNDWHITSANQTIALTEFLLEHYSINKVFINGYSGGGETLSLVLSIKPELYTAALHVASVWNGEIEPIINAKIPIYFVIGENDEYYGSERISNTYLEIVEAYKKEGLSDNEISELVVLDIKPASYFNGNNQHGGIGKVSHDKQIMGWLFNR